MLSITDGSFPQINLPLLCLHPTFLFQKRSILLMNQTVDKRVTVIGPLWRSLLVTHEQSRQTDSISKI